MRKFNPEKELYKIQHGKRNKIIFGVVALLIIIGISSSYALYQIRYTKRIVYNKVNGFSNVTFSKPDNVTISPDKALLLSGETKTFTTTLPNNYKIDTVTCTNSDSSVKTDNTFTVTYKTSAASVCTVTIKQKEKLFNDIIIANGTTIFDDETEEHNLRYAGKNPNNYIWFNCDNYEDLTSENASEHCEKWRIIGLMKNIEKEEGGTEDLVKIIREESIGNIVWDNKPDGVGTAEYDKTYNTEPGSSNWSDSRLMMLLNPGYESNPLNASGLTGSLYWNRQDGKCGATKNNDLSKVPNGTSMECGLGTKGLHDNETKNMIESVIWHLGGLLWETNTEGDFLTATASTWYKFERGTKTCKTEGNCTKEHATEWIGKVALMYVSDYGYATGGGKTYNRQACLNYKINGWNSGSYKTDCVDNDWLFNGLRQWTLSINTHTPAQLHHILNTGCAGHASPWYAFAVRPTLYLKSSVQVKSGEEYGSSTNPYILVP